MYSNPMPCFHENYQNRHQGPKGPRNKYARRPREPGGLFIMIDYTQRCVTQTLPGPWSQRLTLPAIEADLNRIVWTLTLLRRETDYKPGLLVVWWCLSVNACFRLMSGSPHERLSKLGDLYRDSQAIDLVGLLSV